MLVRNRQAIDVTAGEGNTKGTDKEIEATAARESATTKQMSTLVDLMRQQMEWSMKNESSRREQDLGSTEALETRMRGIEVCFPFANSRYHPQQ